MAAFPSLPVSSEFRMRRFLAQIVKDSRALKPYLDAAGRTGALRRQISQVTRKAVFLDDGNCKTQEAAAHVHQSCKAHEARILDRRSRNSDGLGSRQWRNKPLAWLRHAQSACGRVCVLPERYNRFAALEGADHGAQPVACTTIIFGRFDPIQPSASISPNAFHMPMRPTPPPAG